MSVLINDVADYLVTQGMGTVATDIFCGFMPESPNNCIAVLDTGGTAPDDYLPTKEPTFQVYIRSANYPLGKAKLDAVRLALQQKSNVSLVAGQSYIYFILAISEGGHIGSDAQGRDLFSINFHCRTRL